MKSCHACRIRVTALVAFIFLGSAVARVVVLAQEPDKVKSELFREIDAAMHKARQEEVPIFVPTLFAKALELYNRAEADYRKGERIGKIREELQQAMKALNQALEAAKVSKVALAELYDARKKAAQREYINLAPKEFAEAERNYEQAVLKAEAGDIRAAREKADDALRGYREMILVALEEGPLKEAVTRLEQSKGTLSREGYLKAARELAALRNSVRSAKDQKFDIAAFRTDILAKIDGIISVIYPPFYRTPPDTLLVDGFTLVVESYEARRWDFTHNVITNASGIAWTSFHCDVLPLFPHLPPGWKFLSKTFQVVPVVKNPLTEISLQEAQRIKLEAKVGEALQVELPLKADLPTEVLRARKDLFDLSKVKKGDIKVRFENLTIEATARPKVGKVLEGLATYPTPPPLPKRVTLNVAGFTVYLDSLFISPTSATARAELEFPPSIIDATACRPGHVRLGKITISSACQFRAEFPDSTFGPWTIDNTGMVISGKGFVADFSTTWKWPGWTGSPPLAPSWRGVILLSGATTPGSSGTIVSNTGYLKAPYAFTNGLVAGPGLAANFTLTAPFAFKALQPFGYDLSLTAGTLRMQDSHISGGNFLNGDLLLPELAVIDQAGSRIKAHYDSLYVQDDLDLYGRVKIEQPLFWGEFTKTTPSLRAYAVGVPNEGHFYLSGTSKAPFYPLDASGFKEPSVFLLPISAHLEAENVQGVTVWGFPGFIIFTPDTPGPTPIGFGPGTVGRAWLNIVSRGVHGSIAIYEYPSNPLKLGPTYQPFYVGNVPFSTNLVRVLQKQRYLVQFQFIDSAVYNSDVQGSVRLKGPTKADLPFTDMEFTSTAHNAGGKITLTAPVTLDYWGVGVVPKPGASTAGVMSVKTGQILLTAAGLTEPRHFAAPFYLTWGEILASGDLGRLFFDYNSAGQKFDGFNFVTEAVALSPFVPADSTAKAKAYLQAGGTAHFDFFGANYFNVHDFNNISMPGAPFNGRRIELGFDSDYGTHPSDTTIYRGWSDNFGTLDFHIRYDAADQDGFVGVGTMGFLWIENGPLSATINLTSARICMSVDDQNRHDFTLGPVAHFGSMGRTTGCACIEGGELQRVLLSSVLETAGNVNVLLRSATYGSLEWLLTPSISEMRVNGNMHLSLLANGNLEVTGHARFTINRAQDFVEGDIDGRFNTSNLLSGLTADGQLNWHLGKFGGDSYQSIQGRLAVQTLAIIGGSVGTEGGFYVGINAPKEEAWILQDAGGRFKLNMTPLPARLTGVYGYNKSTDAVNYYIFSGGIEVYVGLGGFVLTAAQAADLNAQSSGLPVLPYVIGNLGVHLWGDILGGLVSAGAWGDFNVIGPYPFSFQGTVGLEGCVAWVVCGSVDVTCGLNTAQGFYIE